jgi:hypothetical protein
MQKAWGAKLGLLIGISAPGLACGPDTSGVSSAGSESASTGEASSGGGTTTTNGMTTMPMTSNAEGDTTSAEVTSSPPGDTTTEGSSSGQPGSEGSSSGGEPAGPAYPPCAPDQDPPCPEPYDQCIAPGGGDLGNWCSIACNDATECPVPDSGTAVVVCGGPPMQPTRCLLDCSMGECPDGMSCIGVGPGGNFMVCAWPPA